MAEEWIVIPKWDQHQHPDAARSQVPPWIKVYTELLADPAFARLSLRRRGLLVCLWLEYGRSRRRLVAVTRELSQRLSCDRFDRVTTADLKALNDAGFLEFSASNPASNPASKVASNSASLEKRREEVLPPNPAERGTEETDTPASRNGPAARPCLICGEPVLPGYRCPGCNANPRAAGSDTRTRSKKPKAPAYERAEAFTRAIGLEYPYESFVAELEERGYELSADERKRIVALWEEISPEATPF